MLTLHPMVRMSWGSGHYIQVMQEQLQDSPTNFKGLPTSKCLYLDAFMEISPVNPKTPLISVTTSFSIHCQKHCHQSEDHEEDPGISCQCLPSCISMLLTPQIKYFDKTCLYPIVKLSLEFSILFSMQSQITPLLLDLHKPRKVYTDAIWTPDSAMVLEEQSLCIKNERLTILEPSNINKRRKPKEKERKRKYMFYISSASHANNVFKLKDSKACESALF